MCVIFTAWRAHPEVTLFIAANRDEYYARPTAPAHWWSDTEPAILAGRDLEAGGTWLGLTRSGRFAALTNYRDPTRVPKQGPSRGSIVPALLESDAPVAVWLERLAAIGPEHNPFSVIFSDRLHLGIYESAVGTGRVLAPGIYGLSNHLLNTPWPKVEALKGGMLTRRGDFADKATALALLRDERIAPDEALPRTGVSLEWERLLSSVFVREATYGTRSSTLVRIGVGGRVEFDEWSWDRAGRETAHVTTAFTLDDA